MPNFPKPRKRWNARGGQLAAVAFWIAATSKATEPSIKIGAIFAVTGTASFLGAPAAKTVQMVTDQLNAAGGLLGRPIQLILRNSESNPEKAVMLAEQLIEQEQVLAIIGPSTTGESLLLKPICEEAGVLLLSCAAAEAIVNPTARFVFKTPQKDSHAAIWIFKTMRQKGISQIAVLSDNSGFGMSGKEQLESLAPAYGIEIIASEVYDKGATDLTDILTKIKGQNVQAVVNWSIGPAQSSIAKNLRKMGFDVPVFQSHGFGNIRYVREAGQAAEGILFPASRLLVVNELPDDHPQKSVLMSYKKEYESRYGEEVSTFGGHAYDAIMLLAEAIRRAQSTDRRKVRDALENITGFVGTTGIFNFSPTDHNGLGLDALEMLTIRDGQFRLYRP